jgi:hypothetical protein
LWLLICPTGVAIIFALILMCWSIPVQVHVELTTQRVAFGVDPKQTGARIIVDGMDVRSVGIERFASITFEPDSVEVAVPSEYDARTDSFPSTAWKPLSLTGTMVGFSTQTASKNARVIVEEKLKSKNSGIRVDPIYALPGVQISIETRGRKNDELAITVTNHSSVTLSLEGSIAIIAADTRMSGVEDPISERNMEVTYGVHLRGNAPFIEVAGRSDGLVILPTFRTGQANRNIASNVAVSTLEFTSQNSGGERVSALSGNGLITFPAHPYLGTITINETDAVGLERLEEFSIKSVSTSPGLSGIRIVGDGMAGQIRTKTGQIPIERHLTAFDALTHNSGVTALFALGAWLIPTLLGALRFLKVING